MSLWWRRLPNCDPTCHSESIVIPMWFYSIWSAALWWVVCCYHVPYRTSRLPHDSELLCDWAPVGQTCDHWDVYSHGSSGYRLENVWRITKITNSWKTTGQRPDQVRELVTVQKWFRSPATNTLSNTAISTCYFNSVVYCSRSLPWRRSGSTVAVGQLPHQLLSLRLVSEEKLLFCHAASPVQHPPTEEPVRGRDPPLGVNWTTTLCYCNKTQALQLQGVPRQSLECSLMMNGLLTWITLWIGHTGTVL